MSARFRLIPRVNGFDWTSCSEGRPPCNPEARENKRKMARRLFRFDRNARPIVSANPARNPLRQLVRRPFGEREGHNKGGLGRFCNLGWRRAGRGFCFAGSGAAVHLEIRAAVVYNLRLRTESPLLIPRGSVETTIEELRSSHP